MNLLHKRGERPAGRAAHSPCNLESGLPRSEGVLEYYWGDHVHLGYYTAAERAAGYKKKDFKQAKVDFVNQMLSFAGSASPRRILDVGCGIGGTSRMLASRFPQAEITGAQLGSLCTICDFAQH